MLQLQQVTQRTYFFHIARYKQLLLGLLYYATSQQRVHVTTTYTIHDDALEPILQSRDFTDVRLVNNLLSVL